jgi:urease accessory protein
MLRATEIIPAGSWTARDTVTLAFDDRFRRRLRLVGDQGTEFLLDLAEAAVLRHGDGLKLEGGGVIAVRAADEDLIEITGANLARIAWHIGNRHLPAEIGLARILIRDDHVIVDMLKGLGAQVRRMRAPFNPEGGAYGQHNHDPGHPHAHGHDHDHAHAHGHRHDHHHD